MSKQHVSLLAVILLVVLGAIFLLLPQQTGRDNGGVSGAAIPGLEAAVNDIERLEAVGAGNTVIATLVRGDDGWSVTELGGYAADLAVLRDVLGGLAQARVIEPKTDNPDYYARLGVEDVQDEEAGGVRLDFVAGDRRWSVIVGEEAPTRGGHYLRLAESPGSVLADFEGDVPTEASGWVDTRVVDLLAGEVAEVRIEQPDGEVLTAQKISADETDFTLLELPEGRELKSAWSVNALGSALSTLDLEGVRPAATLSWDDAIDVQALRFDGLAISAELLRTGEDGDWIRLSARAPAPDTEPEPEREIPPDAESGTAPEAAANGEGVTETDSDAETAPGDLVAAGVAAVREEAEQINERVSGWAYRIPGYKADAMDKRLVDLLREPESGESG